MRGQIHKLPTESEVAELVASCGDIARRLAFERDILRELVKGKDAYIACYKTGRRPTEKLFATLERLNGILFPESEEVN